MFHRIEAVRALADYIIEVRFLGGDVKNYDTKIIANSIPQFVELQTKNGLFEQVRVDQGGYGVFWNDDLDIDSDTIWEDGTLVETQKQLSEKTGIYQADISKIERGLGNPSLATLDRLASGLGMKLDIRFLHDS